MEVPRGFSVHVFKTPSPPAYAQPIAAKADYPQNRTPSPGRKGSYPPRPDPARKPSYSRGTDYFGDQVNDYDRSLDLTRTKQQKPYSIYPGAIPDTYIYERSISSVSDLPGSPSSSSSSDTDSIDTPIERCSIRATSSVETLEATLYATADGQLSPGGTSPYSAFYSSAPITAAARPVVVPPLSLSAKYVDDDDSTVVSDGPELPRVAGPTPVYPTTAAVPSSTPLLVPPPVRRNSDERSAPRVQAPQLTRRDSAQPSSRTTSPSAYVAANDTSVRLPPGLQYAGPAPMGRSMSRRPSTSSPVSPTGSNGQRSPMGEQPSFSRVQSGSAEAQIPAKRCVRWTEDLVCPSPILASQRRKGWFNRRGYVIYIICSPLTSNNSPSAF